MSRSPSSPPPSIATNRKPQHRDYQRELDLSLEVLRRVRYAHAQMLRAEDDPDRLDIADLAEATGISVEDLATLNVCELRPMTQAEVAAVTGWSTSLVSNVERQALAKMRRRAEDLGLHG